MQLFTALGVQATRAAQPIAVREPRATTSILNINSANQELHNRFLTAGLIAYAAVIIGMMLILGRRRAAGFVVIALGVAISAMLYLGVFG